MVLIMEENEAQINYLSEQEMPVLDKPVKPRKPVAIKKPVAPQKPIPQPLPIQKEPSILQSPKFDLKETMGFDTLNPMFYNLANYLLLPSMMSFIVLVILTAINFIFFPTLVWNLYGGIVLTVFSLVTFVLIFLIFSTSLKKNDLIVIRKFRSGAKTISRTNTQGRSKLYFNKKDPSSKVLISWSGAITDVVSGCKIIQINEGHPTNDNLNEQVSESEWDKDVARLTKAKSVADLAEAELFNQGLLGLKWQDIVLIVTALLCLGIIVCLFTAVPGEVAKETIKQLLDGTLQTAIAGIVIPTPVTPVA
jgi:hypothetical protein